MQSSSLGFPGGTDGKEATCNVGDLGSIWLGRSPGEGHGNPLKYLSLENPMDRGDWQATAHRVTKSQTQLKQLSAGQNCHIIFKCPILNQKPDI